MELTILIRIINPVNKLKKVLSFLLRAEREILSKIKISKVTEIIIT